MNKQKPIIVIIGPTASGKTEVAIKLARQFNGEIISADSRQFYEQMDIGTAKPTNAEMMLAKHHLINVAQPEEIWSLAMFKDAALGCIKDIQERKKLPFIVGGTGQYIWGLIEGWTIPSEPVDQTLRLCLEDWSRELGPEGIHHVLARLDPQAGEIVQVENVRRSIRALEVIFSSGRRFSEQRLKQPPEGMQFIILGIHWERPALYQRVDMRIEMMMSIGFVEEVRSLLDSGIDPNSPALSAIGYREITGYLTGKHSLDDAVMLMKRNTRQYIRRQANWFKPDDPRITWFEAGNDLAVRMAAYLTRIDSRIV
jgi:tRNA dimethylallyltransferase